MQETFTAIGVVSTGLLVGALIAIGVGTLVMSLKEWLNEKRTSVESTMRLLETQKTLIEANNRLNERVTAIEDKLRGDA